MSNEVINWKARAEAAEARVQKLKARLNEIDDLMIDRKWGEAHALVQATLAAKEKP